MQFDAYCIECLVKRQFRLVKDKHDGHKAFAYLQDVMQCLRDAPKGVAAPSFPGRLPPSMKSTGPARMFTGR